jgi:ATP phosphoribosyltransferase
MLRIALPNKGSLSESALKLVREAGYSCAPSDRELTARDPDNDVEFVFLRPRDIAVYIGGGIVDVGITGRDLALDSEAEFTELLALGFGRSSFCYAVPRASSLEPKDFGGKRIATSYPQLVRQHLRALGLEAKLVRLDGAVEVSVQLGVADLIADVVQSGRTLEQAGLRIVGDPIVKSEGILIGRSRDVLQRDDVRVLYDRLQGILVAAEYIMMEYDCPRHLLEQACQLTPGIESPTVSPLAENNWVAIKAMTRRKQANQIMDRLKALGAKGIIVTDIRSCRI